MGGLGWAKLQGEAGGSLERVGATTTYSGFSETIGLRSGDSYLYGPRLDHLRHREGDRLGQGRRVGRMQSQPGRWVLLQVPQGPQVLTP